MSDHQFYGSTSRPGARRPADHEVGPEDFLRRKLKYFFMNPCQKWKAKRKFPWKLVLQIIKLLLVTIQLWMFGLSRATHIDFLEKSTISFKHLFLKDWTSSLETMPYPPSTGSFAIYTIPMFYESVNYAMANYNKTEQIAMGTYQFYRPHNNSELPPMVMCNNHFKLSQNWARNQSYRFDATTVEDCFNVTYVWDYNNETDAFEVKYDIKTFLEMHNKTLFFDAINMITLKFQLTALHLKFLSRFNSPDCYIFHIEIQYDNQEHDGQMKVKLEAQQHTLPCFGEIHYDGGNYASVVFATAFDAAVILISVASFVLCVRSLIRGHKLKMATIKMFRSKYNKELDLSDRLEFLNMWYVLIIVNDLFTVVGSGFKLAIENKLSGSYESCGILLGTGSLLVWFGVLRYLGFFEKYNILILTMKKSAPNVLRFLVCAAMFYFGFTVCGWVVLGPYHIKVNVSTGTLTVWWLCAAAIPKAGEKLIRWFSSLYIYLFCFMFIFLALVLLFCLVVDICSIIKFRHLSSASECLFSLVNGDDMYVTFAAINGNSYIWWYSRIYLYIFISLFIYVILSVFISVIMDTYETIKKYYEEGFPKTPLQEYIEECTDDAHSLFRSYSTDKFRHMQASRSCSGLCGCLPLPSCDCCKRDDVSLDEQQDSLIT